ncbi:MAG TPA: ABC transporter substrate-binding protein [Gaiellaceae bacterium]|nr:ABC transporter substrate-binding protein [Gaiellaceae bacterium]
MSTRVKLVLLAFLLVAVGAGAYVNRGEGGEPETATAPSTGEDFADPCTRAELELVEPDVLTVGVAGPSVLPWLAVDGGEPEGFEPDLVRAVAEFMFFAPGELRWADVSRDEVLAAGPQGVDFVVGQLAPSADLDATMDFTESYYEVEQAVLARPGTPVADGGATLAELREARLGAPAGASHDTILTAIGPAGEAAVYETPAEAVAGLREGDVDAVLVDYPTALELLRGQGRGVVAAGRLPAQGDLVWALATPEGSTLRACLAAAIANVRQQSFDLEIAQAWIEPDAPPLILE